MAMNLRQIFLSLTYLIPVRKKSPGRTKLSMLSLKAAIIPKINDKSSRHKAAAITQPRKPKQTP